MSKIFSIFVLLLCSSEALAYIGPGAGVSVIASLLGLIFTIVVAIAAVLFWPIRKMLNRKKRMKSADTSETISNDR